MKDQRKQRKWEGALVGDNIFKQRILREITTILRLRLLINIFTHNALHMTTILKGQSFLQIESLRKSTVSTLIQLSLQKSILWLLLEFGSSYLTDKWVG